MGRAGSVGYRSPPAVNGSVDLAGPAPATPKPSADGAGLRAPGRRSLLDPAEHRFRFYELRLQPTLWGRAWGRLGTPGRRRATEYPDREAAGPEVARAVRRRLGRGYRVVAVR